MTTKTRILFIAGMLLFLLGSMITIFFEGTVILIVGLFIAIAGVAVFVRYAVQLIKERREFMMGRKPVTADSGWQAQAEYNKRLAAYSKDGAFADERIQARLFAQAVMTLTLMTPSTAVFSELNETTVAENDGTYTVTGWVDVQNFFGAMIRTPFSMTVFKKDGMWQTAR